MNTLDMTDRTTKKEVKGIGIGKAYRISYGVRSLSELTDTQILYYKSGGRKIT